MAKNLIATHEGALPLGGTKIDCAVLNDGTRILAANAVFKALERPAKGLSDPEYRADQMPSFLSAKNLQPFVNQEVRDLTNLVYFDGISGKEKSGYNAKILRGICKVYLDARKAGSLHKTQEKTAIVCEKILYALADQGIESLVDQATGFIRIKEDFKKEVILFLEKSIQLQPAQWIKTFQDEFFEMIFKMKGWTWGKSTKRPGVMGHYINDIVYSRIAPNVLTELQKINPKIGKDRKSKHHQHLTPEFGHPVLKDHLAGLIALGRVSNHDWSIFIAMVDKAYPKYGQTLQLDFAIDYDKKLEEDNSIPISSFNKSLKQALNYNPKDK